MKSEILIILCGGITALTVYDMLKATRFAGGVAQSGICSALAASASMLGLHERSSTPDRQVCCNPRPARRPVPGAGHLSDMDKMSVSLVYLIGVFAPLIGLGLAVQPLI